MPVQVTGLFAAVAKALPTVVKLTFYAGMAATILSAAYTIVRVVRRAEEPVARAVEVSSYAIPVAVFGILIVFLLREAAQAVREIRGGGR